MGSSISIFNNTPDVWYCKVGSDQAALAVFGAITGAIAAIATIVATAGAAAGPIFGALGAVGVGTSATIAGLSASAYIAIASTASTLKTATTTISAVVTTTADQFKQEGFDEILPGATREYGGKTLSLIQQSQCRGAISVLQSGAEFQEVRIRDVFMRPIASGATAGSTLTHDIQFWINKFGFENEFTFKFGPPGIAKFWGDINEELVEVPPPPFTCPLCLDGSNVTSPEAMVFLPLNGNFTCAEIDEAGKAGNLSEIECFLSKPFALVSCCLFSSLQPTLAPLAPLPTPAPPQTSLAPIPAAPQVSTMPGLVPQAPLSPAPVLSPEFECICPVPPIPISPKPSCKDDVDVGNDDDEGKGMTMGKMHRDDDDHDGKGMGMTMGKTHRDDDDHEGKGKMKMNHDDDYSNEDDDNSYDHGHSNGKGGSKTKKGKGGKKSHKQLRKV